MHSTPIPQHPNTLTPQHLHFYEDLPVSSRNRLSFPAWGLPLLLILSCSAASPASAGPGPQYLAQRTKLHCDRKLTYTEVQANPAAYIGRVIELCGIVGGMVTAGDRLSIMLN